MGWVYRTNRNPIEYQIKRVCTKLSLVVDTKTALDLVKSGEKVQSFFLSIGSTEINFIIYVSNYYEPKFAHIHKNDVGLQKICPRTI